MSFADKIKALAAGVPEQIPYLKTEEATKMALVQPFIRALGYDVNDPREVVPEFTADIAPKNADRVDYAIVRDGRPIMLFECKSADSRLEKDEKWSQLFKYFIATDAKFGILTNGVAYNFYTDLDRRNKLDRNPFLEFNLLEPLYDSLISNVEKFTKECFDQRANWDGARALKYTTGIKRVLSGQLNDPTEEFIKFLASEMDFDMRVPNSVKQRLPILTKQAFNQFIADQVREWSESAPMNGNIGMDAENSGSGPDGSAEETSSVSTTEEELQAYYMIKAILYDTVDVKRIVTRDVKNYCGILLDDNSHKTICRLWFNSSQKYLGIIDAQRREERIPIDDLDDIYKYADRLKARVHSFVKPSIAA